MNLLKGIKYLCSFTKKMALDNRGFWSGAAGPIIGGLIGGLGSLFGGNQGDNKQTTQNIPNPFSWTNYPPQAAGGASALGTSLFGVPSATPESYVEWHKRSYNSYPREDNQQEQANRTQLYNAYLNKFNQNVTYGQSDIDRILYGEEEGGGVSQYYNQFLNEQLPLAMSPYEEFLRSNPDLEWQIIQGDLGGQLNQAQLEQQQYYSQYGTAGAGAQDWERMYGGYMGNLAQQRRLLEQGFGERQMAAGTGYANLGLTGTNVANQWANLQMTPYQLQQQYLNSMLGLSGQGGTQMTSSPYVAPNPITQGLQGAAMGGYMYNQFNQPTTSDWYFNSPANYSATGGTGYGYGYDY